MKLGFNKSIAAKNRGKLSIVEGKGLGNAYHVAVGEVIELEDGVSVQELQGLYLLRTDGPGEVLVSGMPVREKILEFGDRIKLSSLTLLFERDGLSLSTVFFHVELQTWLLFFVLAVVTLAGIRSVDIYEGVRNREMAMERNDEAAAAAAEKNPLLRTKAARIGPESTDPQTEDERLQMARDRYAIADRLYKDAGVDYLNMFWAIQQWKDIVGMFPDADPKPDVVQMSQARLETAEKDFDAHLLQLRYNALVAFQSGRQGDFMAILRYIIRVAPDPENANYRWAQETLTKYGK